MPIRIRDRATGNVTTVAAPTETNQVVVYEGTGGESVKASPIVITAGGEFQRVGAGSIELFKDIDTTSIQIGSASIPVVIESSALTLGSSAGTVSIKGSTINIGETGSTINMIGDVNNQQVVNLNVSDKLITLNDGGAVGSGNGVGIEVEENGLATGYTKTKSDRNGWQLKAPNQAGIATVELDADSFTVDKTIVKGPISGTDNKLIKSDGTNGRLIQETGVSVSDINDVSGINNLSVSGDITTSETVSRALQTDAFGKIEASTVTSTELGYVSGTTSNIQTQIDANETAINNHIADTVDAHDASAVSYVNTTSGLVATTAQAAIDEVEGRVDTAEANISSNDTDIAANTTLINNHINDTVDAHDASAISVVASGNLASTNAQDAVVELQADIDTRALSSDLTAHTGASTGVHGVTGSVVGTTDTQDLSNKTFTDAITLEELTATPTAPLSGDKKFYAKNDGKLYQLDSTGVESEVGSGSGQGGINYIDNHDFEVNTNGWTGASEFTISRTTSTPLRGDGSGLLTKTAFDASGQEIYTAFTVDTADLAKKLTISFDYDASDANYSDGDIRILVRMYPGAIAQDIRINGEDLKAGKGTHYAQFQTDATQTNYDLIFQVNSANAAAYSVKIDNVKVGPQAIAYGSFVGDTISWTPTGSWTTNTTYTGKYRRIGDHMFASVQVATSGIPDPVALTINMPPGLSIATKKLNSTSAENYIESSGGALNAGISSYPTVKARYNSTTSINLVYGLDSSASAANPVTAGTLDHDNLFAFNSGDFIWINFSVPIQGWSLNSQMSEDLGGREIFLNATVPTQTTSITYAKVTLNAVEDTTASLNASSQYIIPESGLYLFSGYFASDSTTDQGGAYASVRNITKSEDYLLYSLRSKNLDTESDRKESTGVVLRRFNKGDVVEIVYQDAGTVNIFTGAIQIQKLASPQTQFETETVAARYTSDSGQAIGTAITDVIYGTKVSDSHGAYNASTGEYTITTPGEYAISARIHGDAEAYSAGHNLSTYISVNGTQVERHPTKIDVTAVNSYPTAVSIASIKLNKGDIVKVQASSSVATNLLPVSNLNTFSIARIK